MLCSSSLLILIVIVHSTHFISVIPSELLKSIQRKAVCSLPVLWLAPFPGTDSPLSSQLPSGHRQLGPPWTSGGESWPWASCSVLSCWEKKICFCSSRVHYTVSPEALHRVGEGRLGNGQVNQFWSSLQSFLELIWESHEFWSCVAIDPPECWQPLWNKRFSTCWPSAANSWLWKI